MQQVNGFRVDGVDGNWQVVAWGVGIGIQGIHVASVRTCSCAVAIRDALHHIPDMPGLWDTVAAAIRAEYQDATRLIEPTYFYSD